MCGCKLVSGKLQTLGNSLAPTLPVPVFLLHVLTDMLTPALRPGGPGGRGSRPELEDDGGQEEEEGVPSQCDCKPAPHHHVTQAPT